MGSFLSSGEKECRVGFSIDLVFTINKEYYSFNSLRAVNRRDNTQSMNDYVQFSLILSESDIEKGVYTVKVTLLKESNDILIMPDCTSFLRVVSYSPSFTDLNAVGIPIVVEFSIPVKPESLKGNVSIIINYEDQYGILFEEPILSENNTVLTIDPKPKTLRKFIQNSNSSVVEAKVTLSQNIISNVSGKSLNLIQNSNSSFSVRYNAVSEDEPPEEQEFFVTRLPITLDTAASIDNADKFNYEDIALAPDQEDMDEDVYDEYSKNVLQNRTGGRIYIYGKYYDSGSGVYSVEVDEIQTTDFYVRPISGAQKRLVRYTASSSNVAFKTVNGITEFCIAHDIQTEDGTSVLHVCVKDAAGNASEKVEFAAIKKSIAVISNIHCFKNADGYALLQQLGKGTISVDKYNNSLKKIEDIIEVGGEELQDRDICALLSLPDALTAVWLKPREFKCVYKNKYGNQEVQIMSATNSDFGDVYGLAAYYEPDKMLNVNSVSGLSLTFYITDDLGNTAVKTVQMPDKNDIFRQITRIDANTASVKCSSPYEEINDISYITQIEYNQNGNITNSVWIFNTPTDLPQLNIKSGYKYKMAVKFEDFCTEICDEYYDISNANQADDDYVYVGNISIDRTQETMFYGSEVYKCLKVTVPVEQESIDKYDYINICYHFTEGYGDDHMYQTFPKGTPVVFIAPTDWFFEKPLNYVDIWGYSRSSGTSEKNRVMLPQYVSSADIKKYDDIPPEVSTSFPFGEEFYLTASDPQYTNGISAMDLTFEGSKTITWEKSGGGDPKIQYPVYDFLEDDKYEYKYTYNVYDDATPSNCNTGYGNLFFYDFPQGDFNSFSENGKNQIIKTDAFKSSENINKSDIKIFTITGSTWVESTPAYTLTQKSAGSDKGYYYELKFTTPSVLNKFIKIITAADDKYSTPGYFYIGSTSGNGSKDKFQPTGFDDTVDILSDGPVFVHTLVTNKPYYECKNWTVKQWEYYKKHVGEEVLPFTSSSTTPQTYMIPAGIEKGECYVIIAHYANGHVAKSSVMVKD